MNLNPSDIRRLICAITKRTGLPLQDEDLEQEAALKAIEAFRRLERVEHPRALLTKIVHDTVRDHWRRRRRLVEDLASVDERFVSHLPAFETDLDLRRRIALLHRALEKISASNRKVLDLFDTRDLTITEIAQLQNRTRSAVKMELLRSRQSLARIIKSLSKKRTHSRD
jgi:RNA polymerase sigma-70 factor (ECF subfamily)